MKVRTLWHTQHTKLLSMTMKEGRGRGCRRVLAFNKNILSSFLFLLCNVARRGSTCVFLSTSAPSSLFLPSSPPPFPVYYYHSLCLYTLNFKQILPALTTLHLLSPLLHFTVNTFLSHTKTQIRNTKKCRY